MGLKRFVEVKCDRCGRKETYEFDNQDIYQLHSALRGKGWGIKMDIHYNDEYYCVVCKVKMEVE